MLRIDQEKIQSESTEQKIFNHFIDQKIKEQQKKSSSTGVFIEKGDYEIHIQGTLHRFTLTNSLLIRFSKSRPNELRIEVYEDEKNLFLGKGSYGVVNKIKITLSQTLSGKWIATNHHRVDKLQMVKENESFNPKLKPTSDEKIRNELKFNNEAGIRSKLVSTGDFRHMVMPRIRGIELRKMLERTKLSPLSSKYIKLSIEQRINIILDLSHDLQSLHAIGIIHRDIKPGNIIVDLKKTRSCFVDFGLSKINDINNSVDPALVGTQTYMSPEQYINKKTGEKSDSYAFAKTVCQLLGLEPNTNLIGVDQRKDKERFQKKLKEIFKKDAEYSRDRFDEIFNELLVNRSDECLGRLNKLKQDVYNTIVFSTCSDPDLRFSLDIFIERFERIKMDVMFFRENFLFEKGVIKEDLIIANSQGFLTRNDYFLCMRSNPLLNKKECLSLIEKGLFELKDKPSVITEFVNALGIKSFLGLDTKTDIVDKINLIYDLYDLSKEFFINHFFDELTLELLDGKNISNADPLTIKKALAIEKNHWQEKHAKYGNSIDQKNIFIEKLFSKKTEHRLLKKFDKPACELKDAHQSGLMIFHGRDGKKEGRVNREKEVVGEILSDFMKLAGSPGVL